VGIRSGFRTMAVGYRKTARVAAISLIFLSLFAPLLVRAVTTGGNTWSLSIPSVQCGSTVSGLPFPGLDTTYWFNGLVKINGPLYVNAIVNMSGEVFWYDINQRLITNDGMDFNASTNLLGSVSTQNTFVWPGSSPVYLNAGPENQGTVGGGPGVVWYGWGKPTAAYCSGWVAMKVGTLVLNQSFYGGQNDATFQLLVALPLFNDTSFSTIVHCPQGLNPCSLNPTLDPSKDPLGVFYTFVAGMSLGLAVLAFMISYASNSMQGKDKIPFVDLMITIAFILLFPYIYNQVATLINYLDMALISGPGSGNFLLYQAQISRIWAATGATAQSGLWGFLTQPLVQLAAWVVDFIVYIGSFILGTIRIWLIAVMIVAFPLSLALKEVPFTRKLGQMVEDTLFGLMLAAIMSSIILGLAAFLLTTGTNGTLFAGGNTWLAAISLLTALLIPTVFAPLTGTLFQTGMQAGIAAGTAAVLAGTGGAMGGIGGFQAMGQAGSAAGSATGSFGNATATTGTRMASMLQQHGTLGSTAYGTMHALRGAGLGLAAGFTSGVGMHEAGKVFRYEMRSPGQIVHDRQAGLQQEAQVQMTAEAQQLVAQHDVTFRGMFSQLGALPPELNASMQQKLGSHYTNPLARSAIEKWYHDTTNAPTIQLASALSRHGWIDQAKYESSQAYRGMVNQSIAGWKQKLNEIDPRRSDENMQKIADLRNLLNNGPEKA